ncbi:MAG: NADH-quinone oxidoreductase subunit NuoG [Chthonomonadales bacterium]|nr:NADH-quinone oxidoreductase subunit NuoG [Chthonomonadales bacterium]
MPDIELVNITINGVPLQVPKGEVVFEAAKRIGVDIPFFCYHPRLSMEAGANCRMCLVDVAMPRKNPDGSVTMARMPKPQTSCSLPVAEGMAIETESEAVVEARRGVLEFLLINHPLDCPICDRGGECPLQNNTLHYGPPTTRFVEEKRHFTKAYPLSDYVVFDRERCIHCARCTRFTQDISGDAQLGFLKRGAAMELDTYHHTTFTSRFSGNTIEVCPVGALLSRTYRFKARPWDLVTQKSICTRCSNGCNIKLDYRLSALQRVNARVNEAVNEEWTCDRGKFGMAYVSADDRLAQPLVREGERFVPASWSDTDGLLAERLREAEGKIGGIGGALVPNEDLYVWQRLFREVLGSGNLDHRMGPHFPATRAGLYERFGHHTMAVPIADLENAKTILVFGADLVEEQPIVYLRVRKAWRLRGARVIEAIGEGGCDAAPAFGHVREFASVSLRHRPGTEVALLNGLLAAIRAESSASGPGAEVPRDIAAAWPLDRAARESGVEPDALRRAARLLDTRELAILAGRAVTSHPHADEVLTALGNLAAAVGNPAALNVPVTDVNAQGAMDLGILPDSLPGYEPPAAPGMDTHQMLEAAARGEIRALWVMGEDLLARYHDTDLARRALENCPFVVVCDHTLTETGRMANVVLPLQTVAERDGTFTNVERRVQRFLKAFDVGRHIRPGWLICAEIAARLGHRMPYFSARDVLRDIAAHVPIYGGCTPRELGDEGVRWGYPEKPTPALSIVPVSYEPAPAAAAD